MRTFFSICITGCAALALAGSAAAQPAGSASVTADATPPAGAPSTTAVDAVAPAPAMAAPSNPDPAAATATTATPTALKHTCMDAINSDQQWTDELFALVQKKMRYDAHNAEAELIALNKRHVVLAYAAIWLLAVGFLFAMWRRQQALRGQLDSLRRELDAAIKGPAT